MNTKLIVALVVVGVVAVGLVGLVSAQIASAPNPTVAPSSVPQSVTGFVGWVGSCLRWGNGTAYGTVAPSQPANNTVPNPYVNTAPTQGYYGYGRGCWGRGLP